MSNIKISFCIPTRNRASFIDETLESIISQANDNVEIVIVDGASTDNTSEVVCKFNSKFNNIVYHRLEKNSGVDRDIARCIEISRGDYCWMFSDDDLLKPGAINRILKEIESKYEIYLCNVTACNLSMKPYQDEFMLSAEVKDRVFNLHDKNELIKYCNLADSLFALFSYNCSIIFSREEWNKTGFNYEFDGTAYELAAALLSFIKRKCRLKYIRNSLVLWRSDNESFQHAGGLVKRFLLDFDGYLKLADKYIDDIEARKSFLKVMTREHPWYTIINVTSCMNNKEQWKQFRGKMLKFGYSPWLASICYALGRNRNLISIAVKTKRRIIRTGLVDKFAKMLSQNG